MTPGAADRRPDWLVVAQEQWGVPERRNQLLMEELARRHPRSRFLFAELPLRAREIRRWRRPRPRQVTDNVWVVRAVRPLPGARLERLSDRMETAQLRRALHRLGMERPDLWTQDPRVDALVDGLPVDRVVHDLTDDWAAFEQDPRRRAAVQQRVESLGRRADLVLACSRVLEAGARAWSDRVHYLPNAVEAPGPAPAVPDELRDLPRPLLGYIGTLHASRLDVDLLLALAALRPGWSFVLLGPDHLTPGESARLLAPANVHHLGVRPHRDVRAYVAALDVCLIPHVVDEFTRSLDPLKLYEYLAAGRPVVATPTGNAPDLAAHVATATTAAGFAAAAERLMERDGPAAVTARQAAVAAETWTARAQAIETLLGDPREPAPDGGVCAVVVSFNTRDLLERSLLSLRGQGDGAQLRTIVVDNASTDGSAAMVRDRFPEVELIELGENAGFARANNVAFRACEGEYVLLLNSDAFLAPGSVDALVAAARRHPRAAAVGPRLLNVDGTLQRSAWPFPHAGRIMAEALGLHRPLRRIGLIEDLGTWDHDEERPVDFVIGACLLLRRDALAEVGGFDERFWLYGEEADLQRRLTDRGWKVVFTPSTSVTHMGGASSSASLPKLRHFYAGQRRFLRKHGTVVAWPMARLALLVGSVLRRRWGAARVALEPAGRGSRQRSGADVR